MSDSPSLIHVRPPDVRDVATEARECVVCAEPTHDRKTTFKPDGRVHYRTYRCGDFEACAARRNAKRRRPRS